MKKLYSEPTIVVEDFTVSEMVAKNCGIIENELTFTQQSSGEAGPCVGDYGDSDKNYAYALFSDLFGNDANPEDSNGDGDKWNDYLFTQAIKDRAESVAISKADICNYISNDTFNSNPNFEFRCTDDTQLLQNS